MAGRQRAQAPQATWWATDTRVPAGSAPSHDAGELVAEHRALHGGAAGELLDVGAAEPDRAHADEDLPARAAARARREGRRRRRAQTTARIGSTPRIVRRRRPGVRSGA